MRQSVALLLLLATVRKHLLISLQAKDDEDGSVCEERRIPRGAAAEEQVSSPPSLLFRVFFDDLYSGGRHPIKGATRAPLTKRVHIFDLDQNHKPLFFAYLLSEVIDRT